jgi:hypothetical protein
MLRTRTSAPPEVKVVMMEQMRIETSAPLCMAEEGSANRPS